MSIVVEEISRVISVFISQSHSSGKLIYEKTNVWFCSLWNTLWESQIYRIVRIKILHSKKECVQRKANIIFVMSQKAINRFHSYDEKEKFVLIRRVNSHHTTSE
jgi:hypothetical protein